MIGGVSIVSLAWDQQTSAALEIDQSALAAHLGDFTL